MAELTAEAALIAWLDQSMALNLTKKTQGLRYPGGYEQVVKEYGRTWTPASRPDWVDQGPIRECFKNALDLAVADETLTYVEGFAQGALLVVRHAWCVDEDGRVVDPTWENPEDRAYLGIPFETRFVDDVTSEQGYYGLFNNDWVGNGRILRFGFMTDEVDGRVIVIGFGEE